MISYLKSKLKTKKGLMCSILVLSTLVIGISYGTFVIKYDK